MAHTPLNRRGDLLRAICCRTDEMTCIKEILPRRAVRIIVSSPPNPYDDDCAAGYRKSDAESERNGVISVAKRRGPQLLLKEIEAGIK